MAGPGGQRGTGPPLAPYLQRPLQGLAVGRKLAHFLLVVEVPVDERPDGLHLHPQVQTLFLQHLRQRKE